MTPQRYRIDGTFTTLTDIEIKTFRGMMDHALIRTQVAANSAFTRCTPAQHAKVERDIETIQHDLVLAWHGTTHLYDIWWQGEPQPYNPNHAKTEDESWVWQ